jgi:branched-chain amino acid transport system substrate-binding protein
MGVVACGSSGGKSSASGKSSSKEPLLIAATMGFTGPLSFYGVPYMHGVEAAIHNLNQEGGIEGRKLELVKNNDNSVVSEVDPKAEEMIAKKPVLFLMGNDDTEGIPGLREAQAHGQLAFGTSGPTDVGSELGSLVYNDWPGDPTEGGVAAEFAQQQKWTKVIDVEDEAIGYTKDICRRFGEAYSKLYPGGVVTTVKYNDSTATTYPAQVSKIAAEAGKASAIFLCGLYTGGPTLIKEVRGAGVKLPIYGFGGGLDGDFWAKEVPGLEPFYSSSIGGINPTGGSMYESNPDTRETELQNQAAEEHGGEKPEAGNFYVGYTAIELLKNALEMTKGNTESTALAEALDKFEGVETLIGDASFTKTCHVPEGDGYAVTQIVNGKGKYLKTITPKPENVPKAPC